MTTATNIGVAAAARFRDVSNAIVSPTLWLQYLNDSYNEINRFSPLWPWLETAEQTVTVPAATRSIALPTDIWSANWVYNTTDDWPMIPQEGRGDQFTQGNLRSDNGQPTTYRLRGAVLEVFPLPLVATTFVLEGTLVPAALAGAGVPVFGQQWDGVLIDGMLAQAYDDDGNDKWADRHQAKFQTGMAKMRDFVLLARTQTNQTIRDRFWG